MIYNIVEVESIKLGVGNIESLGLSSKEVLKKSISWLRERYEVTEDIRYLQKAVWHIYAYLELGYPYESGETEFNIILKYLKMDIEEVFPKKKWRCTKVPLTKVKISQLLGRWNPVLHSMRVGDVVEDIMDKVSNGEEGEYIYHCGKVIKQDADHILWEKTFKLYINEEETVFHNINENRYYVLSEERYL